MSAADSIAGVRRRLACCAGLKIGIQPSPSSTARRIARLLLPPTQIGGCGCWSGPRERGVPVGREVAALERDAAAAPRRLHRTDRLVGQLVALRERHAERGELRLEVSGGEAEDEAPAGEHVEARRRLRGRGTGSGT
jgi:hypothetical protein